MEKAKSKFEEACTALKESTKSKYALAVKAYNKAIAEATQCGTANIVDYNSPDAMNTTETILEPQAGTMIMASDMASDSSVDTPSNQTKQISTEQSNRNHAKQTEILNNKAKTHKPKTKQDGGNTMQ